MVHVSFSGDEGIGAFIMVTVGSFSHLLLSLINLRSRRFCWAFVSILLYWLMLALHTKCQYWLNHIHRKPSVFNWSNLGLGELNIFIANTKLFGLFNVCLAYRCHILPHAWLISKALTNLLLPGEFCIKHRTGTSNCSYNDWHPQITLATPFVFSIRIRGSICHKWMSNCNLLFWTYL